MKKAHQVTTAYERALIVVRMIKTGEGLHSREFDTCFEMFDGDLVMDHLINMTSQDYILAKAVKIRALDLGTPESNLRLLKAVEDSLSNPILDLFDSPEEK